MLKIRTIKMAMISCENGLKHTFMVYMLDFSYGDLNKYLFNWDRYRDKRNTKGKNLLKSSMMNWWLYWGYI